VRAGVLDVSLVTADEDRQRRVARALAPARDRRIDHPQTVLRQSGGEVPAARGCDGRAIDDERARTSTADDTVGTEEDGLDVRRIGDADDDDVGLRGCGGDFRVQVGRQGVRVNGIGPDVTESLQVPYSTWIPADEVVLRSAFATT